MEDVGNERKTKGSALPDIHTLKGLCQGWQFHFVSITNYTSFYAKKIEEFLINDKVTVSCHVNMSLEHYFKRYK